MPMTTKILVTLSATIEAVTGVALIAAPDLVVRLLLGSGVSGAGVAVARVGGCGLLSLALACWTSSDDASPQATRALFLYNLLVALYLGYLRVGGDFPGILLLPACFLHVLLTILFARPAYQTVCKTD
jgi:hypothetical protein